MMLSVEVGVVPAVYGVFTLPAFKELMNTREGSPCVWERQVLLEESSLPEVAFRSGDSLSECAQEVSGRKASAEVLVLC